MADRTGGLLHRRGRFAEEVRADAYPASDTATYAPPVAAPGSGLPGRLLERVDVALERVDLGF
jgi:hypothetical protein